MKLIKVAVGALNQTPLDWENNFRNIYSSIHCAREQEVSLLCLPELCITGYGCEDAFHSPGLQQSALEVLSEIIPHTDGMIVSLGLPLMHGGGLFNTACLVADGELLGFVGKQNLAGEGIHYEPRWFKRWPNNAVGETRLFGKTYPIGDLMFEVGGLRIGFEICEDAWVAQRPGSELALAGVDVILNPSASHFAFGKQAIRERFVLEGARAFHASYLYSNLLGNEAGRAIYDGGTMIASGSQMLNSGPRFSFLDAHIGTAVIDVDLTRMNRARTGSFNPEIERPGSRVVSSSFTFLPAKPQAPRDDRSPWEKGKYVKEEEFTRAVSLALFDYLRKSRSRGFVVSLSGGADSAATAILAALGLKEACLQLGAENFARKLPYISQLKNVKSPHDLTSHMLFCVYQSTRNSSETTRNAAAELADSIAAHFLEWDVDPIVENYKAVVSQALDYSLSWEQDDITLQNVQARARSPGVWMLANITQSLLLSTSNRSEAAVGYATMDGDTSGGLAPIAGIDKAFLRHWLKWMETQGPEGISPLSALRFINNQQPTAELRPASEKQTDENDLMPYDLLDAVERAAIRDKLIPLEVLRRMQSDFPQYEEQQLALWVDRFFKLWCRNQWKRERYAPSFHLDDENLDPKTWCRFPILSGGFARELENMWEEVEGEG